MYYQIFILILSLVICFTIYFVFQKTNLNKYYKLIIGSLAIMIMIVVFRSYHTEILFYKITNPKKAKELVVNQAMAELVYHPEIEKYVKGKDSDEVYKDFRELFALGRRRFSHSELLEWKRLMLQVFDISDRVCAKVFIGNLKRAKFYEYILSLDIKYVQLWVSLMSKAIIYEVSYKEYFPPKESRFKSGLIKVIKTFNDEEEKTVFENTYNTLSISNDKEVCMVAKNLYERSSHLEKELEEDYLKYLVAKND